MDRSLATVSIAEAGRLLRSGECTARDLFDACLSRARERNQALNAYVELFDEHGRHEAEAADALYGSASYANAPLLAGIPLAIKDNILIEGRIASSGSRMLENYRASYDATVIAHLKKQGAVFIGRTNMDEFAMGSSTENSAFGVTRNPYDESRVPGGSSGGSAAAVAGGMALGSLGSDTGGSVRQPASLCGLVGLKSTYGTVSRYGLMALASSLDQIGPFTRTVEDARIVHQAISAYDPNDSTNVPIHARSEPALRRRIGVPFEFLEKGVDPDVHDIFTKTLAGLKEAGCEIVPVSLPSLAYSLAVYYVIQPAEASANLARYDGVRYGLSLDGGSLLGDYKRTRGEGFGRETRRRIMLGTYVLSAGYYDAYYGTAVRVREKIKADFSRAFADVDVIMTPTTPSPAFKIGEKTNDPLTMYLEDVFTVPANIAGLPAMSVPAGFVTRDGKRLPVGVQMTGGRYSENSLFSIGEDVERAVRQGNKKE